MQLNNKVALVTGGTKGIGLAIAESMLEHGMKVMITGRKAEGVKTIVDKLNESYGTSVIGVAADVRDHKAMVDAVNLTIKDFGKLDILIANAGVGHFSPIDEMTEAQWHETIDVNLTGVFHSVSASIPEIKSSKGYIITISSLAGTNFFARGAAYNASKFGLVGFTQAVMLDLRKYGVKVSTIMPGSVSTYFNNHVPSDADAWKIQPEDIGQMVIDLLKMNPRTLPSKVEVRPSIPPSK